MARLLVCWNTTNSASDNVAIMLHETAKGRPEHRVGPATWIVDVNHSAASLRDLLARWRGVEGQVFVLDLVTHEHADVGRSGLDEHELQEVLGMGIAKSIDDGSKFGYGFGPEKPKQEMPWRTLGKPVAPDFKRQIDPRR